MAERDQWNFTLKVAPTTGRTESDEANDQVEPWLYFDTAADRLAHRFNMETELADSIVASAIWQEKATIAIIKDGGWCRFNGKIGRPGDIWIIGSRIIPGIDHTLERHGRGPLLLDAFPLLKVDYTQVEKYFEESVIYKSTRKLVKKNYREKPENPKRLVYKTDVEDWYKQRVKKYIADGKSSSRGDDEKAAYEHFYPNINRNTIRECRKKFAPASWHKRGRPKNLAK